MGGISPDFSSGLNSLEVVDFYLLKIAGLLVDCSKSLKNKDYHLAEIKLHDAKVYLNVALDFSGKCIGKKENS